MCFDGIVYLIIECYCQLLILFQRALLNWKKPIKVAHIQNVTNCFNWKTDTRTVKNIFISKFQNTENHRKTNVLEWSQVVYNLLQNILHEGNVMLVLVKSTTRSNTSKSKYKSNYLKFVLRSFVWLLFDIRYFSLSLSFFISDAWVKFSHKVFAKYLAKTVWGKQL